MLHQGRLVFAALLVALAVLVAPSAGGQDIGTELRDAADRFSAAERGIKNVSHDEYWLTREKLAERALRIAETDLASKDAEKILHRILDTPRTTPTVMKAAKCLAEHHATSELTLRRGG